MSAHIFGIRHHGPGSARSLSRALETLQPDYILIEGPPEGEAVLPLVADEQMQPPICILIYVPDAPSRAMSYPFAVFSPEWQAIRYGLRFDVPVRFMDLPCAHWLALDAEKEAQAAASAPTDSESEEDDPPAEAVDGEDASADPDEEIRDDPMGRLAEATGFADGETLWERLVEQRRDDAELFQAVLEMMTALRESTLAPLSRMDALREAWMRQMIRAAEKQGFKRIVVVCGAWHAPALATMPSAKSDVELLRGLPKLKTAATWIPWTYGRLGRASGYGAGMLSPAWYEHLWIWPEDVAIRWITSVAKLFREEDLDASPASVIEAVRLAEALAALRGRLAVGLPELWEAVRSVFCGGSDTPMDLVRERLIVGERLGCVPESTPMLPIQQDVKREQRRLRLQPDPGHQTKDLDLRDPTGLERSHLLHRLNLLDVSWGRVQKVHGAKGTFHEIWGLLWYPELEIKLIEANVWGSTVRDAAAARVAELGAGTEDLSELTALLERALLANLPEGVENLIPRLERQAALAGDVPHMMAAVPPLANVLRYGTVRKTDAVSVGHVVASLLTRICIGLPPACASLNDEAATNMHSRLVELDRSIRLLPDRAHDADWSRALALLADQAGVHGLVAGRCCRILLDRKEWQSADVEQRLCVALSPAGEAQHAAAWIEGFLSDGGELLVHADTLFPILDRWLAGLNGETFMALLPLLRRTFGTFPAPLRRQIGARARGGRSLAIGSEADSDLDVDRASRVLPLVARILGLNYTGAGV